MRKHVQRRHDAHVRAHSVCTEHSALLDAAAGGQKTRDTLSAQVADVDRLLALQERSIEDRRAATEQGRLSRQGLRDAANLVIRVGKLVHLSDVVMGTMQLPTPGSDDELLAYARGLLDRVSVHAEAFVASGLPPDSLKGLADAIQRLEAARDAQAASRQRFTAASQSIRATLDETDKTVGVLEALVINTPAAHPEVLTKLRMAKRVGPRATTSAPARPAPTPAPPAPTDKAAA
ncbi:MAG TPA: hypothetical protein VEP46_00760 [Vicinamibacterales bacterium]|nr:hypothetical protein [Vicinamibacterales bacterium]